MHLGRLSTGCIGWQSTPSPIPLLQKSLNAWQAYYVGTDLWTTTDFRAAANKAALQAPQVPGNVRRSQRSADEDEDEDEDGRDGQGVPAGAGRSRYWQAGWN